MEREGPPSLGNSVVSFRRPKGMSSWSQKFMADLDARSDRRQADLVRRGLSPTVVEMDGQNRILLPKILLEYAGLKDEVLYVQARGKTLELWNPERYNEKYGLQTNDAIEAFDAAFYGEGLTEGDNGR